jgi:putative transposase
MKIEELKQIALAAARNIKTQQDLAEFQKMLTKVTVKAALNAKLDDHLGNERHEKSVGSNHRNGYSSKTVQTDVGQFELDTPRDRNADLRRWMTRSCFFMPRA